MPYPNLKETCIFFLYIHVIILLAGHYTKSGIKKEEKGSRAERSYGAKQRTNSRKDQRTNLQMKK